LKQAVLWKRSTTGWMIRGFLIGGSAAAPVLARVLALSGGEHAGRTTLAWIGFHRQDEESCRSQKRFTILLAPHNQQQPRHVDYPLFSAG
jgi:hypothetical protein